MPGAKKVIIVDFDIVTPYGWGIDTCWRGLSSGQTAIRPLTRFPTKNFQTQNAATIPDLKPETDKSIVLQMLTPLLENKSSSIPSDAYLILSTTTGEIDILERSIPDRISEAKDSCLTLLLDKVQHLCGIKKQGIIISSACASSGSAIAQGAALIRAGDKDCVLIVACDCVSEFVMAGFSSLMALDQNVARPFDKNRNGLTLGEAAGYVLLMSDQRAKLENRNSYLKIAGWGLACDSNHMTGPSKNGDGLTFAICKSLQSAKISIDDIGFISAHGTGTIYNDSMEMTAFKRVFNKKKIPTYSIKGGTGHTMGAAGLIEVILTINSLNEKIIPPTINMHDVDEEAKGWVFSESCSFEKSFAISTNSGFGGVNIALVLNK